MDLIVVDSLVYMMRLIEDDQGGPRDIGLAMTVSLGWKAACRAAYHEALLVPFCRRERLQGRPRLAGQNSSHGVELGGQFARTLVSP